MKSIIDVSVYIIVMTIMCFISLDFIFMNRDFERKQETIEYIRDYVEIYGTAAEAETLEDGSKSYAMDVDVLEAVTDAAKACNMNVNITYKEATQRYLYYTLEVSYNIHSTMLGIDRQQKSVSLVRIEAAS